MIPAEDQENLIKTIADEEKQPKSDQNSNFSHQNLINEKISDITSPEEVSTEVKMVPDPKMKPEVTVPICHIRKVNRNRKIHGKYSKVNQMGYNFKSDTYDVFQSHQKGQVSYCTRFWRSEIGVEQKSTLDNQNWI